MIKLSGLSTWSAISQLLGIQEQHVGNVYNREFITQPIPIGHSHIDMY